MTTLPEPPSPLYVGHLRWMPLYRKRLKRSAAWRRAKKEPELAFYMLNLWMEAWESDIAGSLEDDDDALADAACCEPERWAEIREQALHGFVKCSDGLLYHDFVYSLAQDAIDEDRRFKQTQRQRASRARKESDPDELSQHVTACHKKSLHVEPTRQDKTIDKRAREKSSAPGTPSRSALKGPRSGDPPPRDEPDLSGLKNGQCGPYRALWLAGKWDGYLETRPDQSGAPP